MLRNFSFFICKAIFIIGVLLFLASFLDSSIRGTAITLIVLAVVIYIVLVGTAHKCPKCGKWFALKETAQEAVNEENVSVKVETNRKDNDGNVVGTQEQYVPGKRITYQVHYVCKKCGESFSTTKTKDVASI